MNHQIYSVRLWWVLLACLPVSLWGQAQIIAGEYYFDQDPGVGLGQPIVIPTPKDTVDILTTIETTNLLPGVHTLYIRTQNQAGRWSQPASQSIVISRVDPVGIVGAEYYWDADPGVGNGLPLAGTAIGDTGFVLADILVPSNLSLGAHRFYTRSVYRNGTWSLVSEEGVEICTDFGPQASFELVQYGDLVYLTNTSQRQDTAFWLLDSQPADPTPNPTYLLPGVGMYEGVLIAENDCGQDTARFAIRVDGMEEVVPTRGGQNGLISGRVLGVGLAESGWSLSFEKTGNSTGGLQVDTAVWIDDQNIYFTLSLLGAEIGAYDIVYTLNGVPTYRLDSAFFVDPMIQPVLSVDLVGQTYFRDAEFGKLYVTIENTGNVDALMVPVIIEGIPTGEGQIFESFRTVDAEQFEPFQEMYQDFAQNSGRDPQELNAARLSVPIDSAGEGGYEALSVFVSRIPPGTFTLPIAVNLFRENQAYPLTAHVLNPGIAYTNTSGDSAFTMGDCLLSLAETVLDAVNLFGSDLPACLVSLFNVVDRLASVGNGIYFNPGDFSGIKTQISKVIGGQAHTKSPSPAVSTVGVASTTGALMTLVFRCAPVALKLAAPGAAMTLNLIEWTKKAGAVGQVTKNIRRVSLAKNALLAYERCFGPKGAITRYLYAVFSRDPNFKSGPGVPGDNFVSGLEPLNYTIEFENVDTATAPAQVVIIHDTLDTSVYDLSSFEFAMYGFDTVSVPIFSREQRFTDIFDLRPGQPNFLQVEGALDQSTGVVTWTFTTLDTHTLRKTSQALEGFLPPNVNKSEGQGFVSYRISLREDLAESTVIRNRAEIIFDSNEPIITNTWENIYDITPPVSQIMPPAMPPVDTTFSLSWEGTDDLAGIRDYDIYVSVDDEPYVPATLRVIDTTLEFVGEPGRTYKFVSIAHDRAGNEEAFPAQADVVVSIPTHIQQPLIQALSVGPIYPQPAHEFIHIPFELPLTEVVQVRVLDAFGRTVRQGPPQIQFRPGKHEIELDVRTLTPGIYVLALEVGEVQQHVQMIID